LFYINVRGNELLEWLEGDSFDVAGLHCCAGSGASLKAGATSPPDIGAQLRPGPNRYEDAVPGEVPEWLNGTVSKTVVSLTGHRGFESLSLRQNLIDPFT
jgi:hypothetical protein